MKIYLLGIFALALISSATALVVETDKQEYNLGDSVIVSYSEESNISQHSIFRLNMQCSNYNLEYFIVPVLKGSILNGQIPSIPLSKQAEGDCLILAKLSDLSGNLIDEAQSDSFEVVSQFDVDVKADKTSALPGEKIGITITLSKLTQTTVIVQFEDKQDTHIVSGGSLKKTLVVSDNAYSGINKIRVLASDEFGNLGEDYLDVEVIAVPTTLEVTAVSTQVAPGNEAKFTISLLDQRNQPMAAIITYKLVSAQGKELVRGQTNSDAQISHILAHDAEPGQYTIEAEIKDLSTEEYFDVTRVKDVSFSVENTTIILTNKGNVKFDETVHFIANDGKNVIELTESFNIKPSQDGSLDLASKLKRGTYEITSSLDDFGTISLTVPDTRNFVQKNTWGFALIGAALGIFAFRRRIFKKKKKASHRTDEKPVIIHKKMEKPIDPREDPKVQKFVQDQLKGR